MVWFGLVFWFFCLSWHETFETKNKTHKNKNTQQHNTTANLLAFVEFSQFIEQWDDSKKIKNVQTYDGSSNYFDYLPKSTIMSIDQVSMKDHFRYLQRKYLGSAAPVAVIVPLSLRNEIDNIMTSIDNSNSFELSLINSIHSVRRALWETLEEEFSRFRFGNEDKFRAAQSNLQKDINLVEYILDKCKDSTLIDISNAINEAISQQLCPVNDSWLMLSKNVDSNKFELSLKECAHLCLSNKHRNGKSYQYWRDNLASSSVWVSIVNPDSNPNSNGNNTIENVNEQKDDLEIKKNFEKSDERETVNVSLFDKINSEVIDSDLEANKQFIKETVIELLQDKEQGSYFRELVETIDNWSIAAKGTYIQQNTLMVNNNNNGNNNEKAKDLMKKYGGIQSDFILDDLPNNNTSGFNPAQTYDMYGYLTKMLIAASKLNEKFQNACEYIFSKDYLGVECTFSDAPMKTRERCMQKANIDYGTRPWPRCSHILDVIRCSCVFNTPKDLLIALKLICNEYSFERRHNKNKYDTLQFIVRIKNGFKNIAINNINDCNLNEFNYCDVKLNMLISDRSGFQKISMICEIQLLLSFMLKVKKNGHASYSFVRNENYFNDLSNSLNDLSNNETKIIKEIQRLMLSKNIRQLTIYLNYLNCTRKQWLNQHISRIKEMLQAIDWPQGTKLLDRYQLEKDKNL